MQDLIFYSFSFFILIAALLVISVRNPVHSVLYLIFAFFNTTGLFILLGAEYIAITLVIVYVGAVMVLFLFMIMMLDIELKILKDRLIKNIPIVLVLGIILFIELYHVIAASEIDLNTDLKPYLYVNNTSAIGLQLYTTYFLPFQISGLILLVSMIGAIVLTLTPVKNTKRQNIYKQNTRNRSNTLELIKVKTGQGVEIKYE